MSIRSLQSKSCFGVNCEVSPDSIRIGILVTKPGLQPGKVPLFDSTTGERYWVRLPEGLADAEYAIELERVERGEE